MSTTYNLSEVYNDGYIAGYNQLKRDAKDHKIRVIKQGIDLHSPCPEKGDNCKWIKKQLEKIEGLLDG